MHDDDTPIEGEVTPPEKGSGKGGKKPGKSVAGRGFSRQRTPEELDEEKAGADPFYKVVTMGDGWWRRADFEPTKEEQQMVQMLKFSGYTDEDVAAALRMSVETLQKYFSFELKNAKTLMIGDLATRAFTRARQGNDVLTMFLLKTRSNGAFSEKVGQAAAIADSLKDVDSLSDEKKAQVISSLVDLFNPKKQKKTETTKNGGNDDDA